MTSPLPILLCDATFSGTLAAVRSLGRSGVPVVVADSASGAPAFWSRYATRTVRCPPIADVPAFIDWVMRFGQREGRHVFHPTSDELVYIIAAHHAELSTRFALYQPDLPATLRVLDKKLLYEAAREAGLGAPDTWFPRTSGEVESVAREAVAPLMIKPRTQAFLRKHPKGAPSGPPRSRGATARRTRSSTARGRTATRSRARCPSSRRPMPPAVLTANAAESICSVTGFRDVTGKHLALLGSVKVLQRPRRVGIGLCFESAPLPAGLFEKVSVFLERLGFFGIFELEFVRDGDALLLIDMNPRFYHQVALDVARGLDLPHLAYAAALGHEAEVARLAAAAPSDGEAQHAFCNRIGLEMLVGAQRLFGKMTPAEAARWRGWTLDPTRTLVDSVAEDGDPGPLIAEIVRQVYGCVRHPRSFVRMIALDR